LDAWRLTWFMRVYTWRLRFGSSSRTQLPSLSYESSKATL
jgi:hypothetical protein